MLTFLRGKVNNIDYLITVDLSGGGSEKSVLEVDVAEAEKMVDSKDLRNFDKDQTLTARWFLQNGRFCSVFPVCSG